MLELKIGKAEDAMDWLTFIASVVGSVAWPIAAFSIAFLFRSQIIKLSPAAAVIDAWRSIEYEVRRRASPLEITFTSVAASARPLPFRQGAKILLDAGQITASTYALLMDLNQLRNSAAHGGDISAADAIRFTVLAKQAQFFLDGPDVRPDNPDIIDGGS